MADTRSYTKPQSLHRKNHPNVNSQVTHILFKSLVLLLFLIAIPLFPSQAPDFMNHAFLTKFWELFHLLFIGLAVCYGLFSRRNVDLEYESAHLNNSFDDSQSSNFVSRIFQVSPIFEDVSDENNVYPNWNDSQLGDSRFSAHVDSNESETARDEHIRGFQESENRSEISLEQDENSVVQAWSSQYFHGEPVVVVSRANAQWGELPVGGGSQPLGLPVRSLNSRVRNFDISNQFSNGIQSDSSTVSSSNCSMEGGSFCDQGSANLEEQLNENSFLPSENQWHARPGRPELRERVRPASSRSRFRPLSVDETQFESFRSHESQFDSSFTGDSNCSPVEGGNFGDRRGNLEEKLNENGFFPLQNEWGSRSGRPELRERVVPKIEPSHFRPLSADETQLESFKSRSLRSDASFSSQTSSMSTSPEPLLSSRSDSSNSESEELKMKRREEATLSPLGTQLPEAAKNREAPLNAFHLRKYSSGSLFQKDTQKKAKDDSKDSSHRRKDHEEGYVKLDKKLTNNSKASSRGKSVRTIRSGAHSSEVKKASKIQMDGSVGKGYGVDVAKTEVSNGFNKKDADSHSKVAKPEFAEYRVSEKKEALEYDVAKNEVSIRSSKKKVESHYKMPKPTFEEYRKGEKKEVLRKEKMESEQESESEIDNFQVKLDKGASITLTSDSVHDPDEVDKKAGEFIAKFREQIRLQKVASVERSKGVRMSGKYLR